jgi:type II secretory ATPase GspE/PulE/Tfp pilus assembly ATPase PilB-like protein
VAIGAALTGHMIFTSMHSGDAAEVVVRLLEMGIPPYQLVSALRLICAQRLVRKGCRRCGAERRPDCPACLGTGYSGRTAIAHLVRIDEDVRSLILRHPPASELRVHLARQGPSLAEAGQRLISREVTDAAELAAVLGTGGQTGAESIPL